MRLLGGMTFAKGLILVCVAGSGYLGWRAWQGHSEIQELQAAMEPDGDVQKLVRQIQENSGVYTSLKTQAGGENLTVLTDPNGYIRNITNHKNIELGRIGITPRKQTVSAGIVDHQYRISPETKDAKFQLTQIANFLYMLENRSNRVRVTQLQIGLPVRVDPGDFPPGEWTLDCTITSRQMEQE